MTTLIIFNPTGTESMPAASDAAAYFMETCERVRMISVANLDEPAFDAVNTVLLACEEADLSHLNRQVIDRCCERGLRRMSLRDLELMRAHAS